MSKEATSITIIILIVILGIILNLTNNKDEEKSDEPLLVICPQDMKLCSDGSYVGRISPDCSFLDCPKISEIQEIKKIDESENGTDDESGI